MNFKYQQFINYSNPVGTFTAALSNNLCALNISRVPSLKKAVQLKEDDNADTYIVIHALEEYTVFYLKGDGETIMFYAHYSFNLNSVKEDDMFFVLINEYLIELIGAQTFSKENYKGKEFESVNFVYVTPEMSEKFRIK